jgi:hypothetical protein
MRVYADSMYSLETGRPAGEKTMGMPVFKVFEQDHELARSFNDAMSEFSGSVAPAVIDAYDFSGIDVLVDIAGGHGQLLTSVLAKHPRMRGILFDLEHVTAGAVPRIAQKGLQFRCEVVSGDFFKSVPPGGDAYMMMHIIHDWDDEQAVAILKNVHAALRGKPNGRLILVESVIQPGNQPDMGKIIDLEMMLLPGGRERTAEEFATLFTRAGFTLTRVVPTRSPKCVIEGRP